MCVRARADICVFACMWRPGVNHRYPHDLDVRQDLLLAWTSPSKVGCLATALGICLSASPVLGLQALTTEPFLFCDSGDVTHIFRLAGKHSSNRSTSPTLSLGNGSSERCLGGRKLCRGWGPSEWLLLPSSGHLPSPRAHRLPGSLLCDLCP